MGRTDDVEAWAACGALALTGTASRPLGPPAGAIARMQAVAGSLRSGTSRLGVEVAVDPLELLVERAAIAGLERRGPLSCGGATRMLGCADGWIAASLARSSDLELLPAWVGIAAVADPAETWEHLARAVADLRAQTVVDQGVLLGMAIGRLPPSGERLRASRRTQHGDASATTALDAVTIVDLTSLWAGPLCGSILTDAGARVIKVESTGRPDGARYGSREFFDLMNAGKELVSVDLATEDGRRQLETLLHSADVVLESSRPRALEQLGIDAAALVTNGGPRVWLSLTGHGRDPDNRHRVGFGDDAAVAGGLVAWDGAVPTFCADAIADPLSGLTAADAVVAALQDGGRWLLDVALADVAAEYAGPTLAVADDVEALAPIARRQRGTASALGADNATVWSAVADGRRR